MANRKQRIDSITAQVEVMQAATKVLQPPSHIPLNESDVPFWRSIVAEKPKVEWSDHDLEIAALLAMAMRKMGEQECLVDDEGPIVVTAGGNMAHNPRCRVVADLHARVIKYRQTLGIHNRAKHGEARDVKKRREQAFDVENNNPLDDDLLARPTVQ
jgi:hypothetical protein